MGLKWHHDGRRRTDLERIELLRQTPTGYDHVGTILDGQDAADPSHQGCMVFSFDDFATASIARDTNGVAIPRAIITANGNSLGPGPCTYDAESDSGVLLVITTVSGGDGATDVEFSLHATGVHP